MTAEARPGDSRAGFTLIELLVVLFVIGLLMALLLPAVQGAREAARRAQCVSHLKQIGLALHHYEATHRYFPAINPRAGLGAEQFAAHYYSPLVRMLRELEQGPLYDAINFEYFPDDGRALLANQTAMTTTVGLFLCPSDARAPVLGYGRVSYRFNVGPTPAIAPGDHAPGSWDGPFTTHRFYAPADFRDGLAHTVGASERLQGDWTDGPFRRGGDYYLGRVDVTTAARPDAALAACAALGPNAPHESRAGESWFFSGFPFACYNHCAPPNPPAADCSFFPFADALHDRILNQGVFSATSAHPGGVNTLRMDGSVQFAANATAPPLWRALATRSGGEVVAAP